MITYIIESQGLYKIGKTENMDYRLSCYRTHNPKFELIYTLDFDCESFLQSHFKKQRFKLEWFNLTIEDIYWIKNNNDLLLENTHDILKEKKKKQKQVEIEEAILRKKKKRILTKEKEILRRQLQDKEEEMWLLKKIRDNPDRFK